MNWEAFVFRTICVAKAGATSVNTLSAYFVHISIIKKSVLWFPSSHLLANSFMALFGMFVIGVSKHFSVSKKSDVSTVIIPVNIHAQFPLAGPGFKHSISLYWFPCSWREAGGDIWCIAVREYFLSPDITALQRASGSLCPFYNQGWGYFPHPVRVLQRRVYLRLTAIVIQKVDIKLLSNRSFVSQMIQ